MEQDYYYLCDKQFDKEFDSVETLIRYPWVGNKYAESNYRILILGDSHYATDNDGNPSDEEYANFKSNKESTRGIINSVIDNCCKNESTWPMFRNLINTFTSLTPDEVIHLWSKVAFYNFIQEPMKLVDQVPTSKERRDGWRCYYDVVNILKPDFWAQGGFSVDSPRLTKYLGTTEHEEWQVIDAMHLSPQSFDF